MQKYSINYYYKYSKDLVKAQLLFALDNLDFEPMIMYIGYGDNEIDSIETDFNYNKLFELLETNPTVLQISNEIYDVDSSENYKILKISTHQLYDTFDLLWSNVTISKFIDSLIIEHCIYIKEFICGYCYDKSDAFTQLFKYREIEDSGKQLTGINLYGRLLDKAGLMFIASPIIWFGTPMYEIIERNAIQAYPNSILSKKNDIALHTINLFDINSLPDLKENRIKQKEIWDTLNIEDSFKKHYERKEAEKNAKLGITPDMDLIEYLKIMTGKKTRKR